MQPINNSSVQPQYQNPTVYSGNPQAYGLPSPATSYIVGGYQSSYSKYPPVAQQQPNRFFKFPSFFKFPQFPQFPQIKFPQFNFPLPTPWGGGYNPRPNPNPQPIPNPNPTPEPNPTPTPVDGLNIPDGTRPVDQDWRGLTNDQRTDVSGLSGAELGTLHVGGRGLAFTGSREGIYQSYWTVLEKVKNGDTKISDRDKEAVLAAEQSDIANNLPSGMSFERNYLQTLTNITGSQNFVNMMRNAPVIRDTGKRLQTPADINPASKEFVEFQKSIGNNNANIGSLMVLTQWNHDMLDNGKIDGSVGAHELASQQKGTALVNTPDGNEYIQALAENELADKSFNNSTAKFFGQAFANAYGTGAAPVDLNMIKNDTAVQAQRQGVTLDRVKQFTAATVTNFVNGTKDGFGQGLRSAMGMVKDHPILAGANAATIAASAGVCPYLSGLSVNIANTLPIAQGIDASGNSNNSGLPLV